MPDDRGYQRRSARVILLDRNGRIMLMSSYHDPANPARGTLWVTPGGGVDDGETLAAAAAREVREEIGLDVDPEDLGQPVAHTSGYAAFSWAQGFFRDDFFYFRIDSHSVEIGGLTALERAHHAGHRWWPLSELATTSEIIYPLELAPLATDLYTGRIPDRPVVLPWHH